MTNNIRVLNLTDEEILDRFAKHIALVGRIQDLIALYQRSVRDADAKYAEAADAIINGSDESLQNRIDAAQFSQMFSDCKDFVMDLENALDPPENETGSTTTSTTIQVEVAA